MGETREGALGAGAASGASETQREENGANVARGAAWCEAAAELRGLHGARAGTALRCRTRCASSWRQRSWWKHSRRQRAEQRAEQQPHQQLRDSVRRYVEEGVQESRGVHQG